MSADQFTTSGVFRVGDVLGRAWRIFAGNLVFFLGTTVFIYALMVAAIVAAGRLVGGAVETAWVKSTILAVAVVLALGVFMVGQGVLVLGAFQRMRGQPLRIGAALGRALARALPLLVLAIVGGLGLGIGVVLSLVAVSFGLWGPGSGVAIFLAVLALPVCLVPVAILFVTWSVVVPACVVEGLGPFASLSRSTALTRRYRWKIFGIMLLLGLVSGGGELIDVTLDPVSSVLATVLQAVWMVAFIAFWNCTIIMIYHDLRVAKEGIDTGQVAAIFD